MGERVIDKADGITESLIEDASEKRWIVKRTADVQANIDLNKRLMRMGDGYSPSRDLRRVASIPNSVVLAWVEKYGVDPTAKGNEALLRRLLNDPEWFYLRTAPGRL
jgi:hypothetical protein